MLRVEGFNAGRFVVGGRIYEGGIVVWPGGVVPAQNAEISAFAPLLALDPPADVILVGTGSRIRWLQAETTAALAANGAGVDVMTSRLAAHTYNVLVGEGRQVGALLLPIDA